ncbi:DMT family transporter [Gymnodinialimonas ceratoperidinii]|uniref:DMT family transporter n=1 Tax=Gymnodinialimonas ceratoperidinii TaxID=2856823 RepID=A0A8F6YCS8_9RHOB|nr:DMT family transporter [Gymnodinialimonas ceratoperidinii]QXT39670.1 DMT family transporter [Gymnodinialimonas ceratoperidinii]
MTPNLKGSLLMMGSMAAFTLNDVVVKLLADELPLFQIVFLRGLLTTLLLTLTVAAFGKLSFHVPRPDRGKVALRTLFEIVAMVTFLTALINMQIANATAILSALPLAVTLGAALMFKEQVGWRRLSAICVGAFGVLLIVQPGAEGFNSYSLLALVTVVLVAGRDLVTRSFSPELPSMTVAVITAAAICVFGGVMMVTEEWVPLQADHAALLALAAFFIIGGYVFSILVMRVGEVAVTAPFRYSSLVFALVMGWLVFAELPNALALTGAVIVVVMGVFTLIRERQVKHG